MWCEMGGRGRCDVEDGNAHQKGVQSPVCLGEGSQVRVERVQEKKLGGFSLQDTVRCRVWMWSWFLPLDSRMMSCKRVVFTTGFCWGSTRPYPDSIESLPTQTVVPCLFQGGFACCATCGHVRICHLMSLPARISCGSDNNIRWHQGPRPVGKYSRPPASSAERVRLVHYPRTFFSSAAVLRIR